MKITSPYLFFFDIDATISTRSLSEFFANRKTSQFLQKNNIPYIVITGRTGWYRWNDTELKLYGLHVPDAVIAGNGTTFLWRNDRGELEKDNEWIDLINKNWDRDTITKICKNFSFSFQVLRKKMAHDKPLFFYYVRNAPVDILFKEIAKLKELLPNNVKIEISESLFFKNTPHIFSGGIFVVPEICGKAGVINYILDKFKSQKIDILLFGDACIDIPMLSLPSTKHHIFHPYLVAPTPLAKVQAKEIKQITILHKKGPEAIQQIIQSFFPTQLSIAQNNPTRKIVGIFESWLDRILDKSLSPNDISLLGLASVISGAEKINSHNPIQKIYGFAEYLFGNFTDVLDGIRARKNKSSLPPEIPGQLLDGFCDRAKEFLQLYLRAKQTKNNDIKDKTFLAALSCTLPSIARALAEIQGVAVQEKDPSGGSMIDRTKFLIASLFFQMINTPNKAFEIDEEMYKKNLAAYRNRIKYCSSVVENHTLNELLDSSFDILRIHSKNMTDFQTKALERFLLYVDILQQEYNLVADNTSQQSNNETMQQLLSMIQPYLDLNIKQLRKTFGFKTYELFNIKQYIIS